MSSVAGAAGVSCRYLGTVRTISWCTRTQSFRDANPTRRMTPAFPPPAVSREPAALQHDWEVPRYRLGAQAGPANHSHAWSHLPGNPWSSLIDWGFAKRVLPLTSWTLSLTFDPDPPSGNPAPDT